MEKFFADFGELHKFFGYKNEKTMIYVNFHLYGSKTSEKQFTYIQQ